MADILLSNRAMSPDQLIHQCSIDTDEIYDDQNIGSVLANRPYLVNKQPSRTDLAILYTLRNARKNEELAEIALAMGEDNTLALAEIMNPLKEHSPGIIGATTGAYNNRMSGFQDAVTKYQTALIKYREKIKSGAPKASQQGAKQQVFNAHKIMQQKFQVELGVISNHARAKKGTALSNPTRATNIAQSSRNATKLKISNQTQAHNLVNFSKYARYLGNGLTVLDFSERIGNIHVSYLSGKNWEKKMFSESLSFALSTAAGGATISAGGYALSFLMVMTPIGWTGLIAGGALIAGASAMAAYNTNNYTKGFSDKLYDDIMSLLSVK